MPGEGGLSRNLSPAFITVAQVLIGLKLVLGLLGVGLSFGFPDPTKTESSAIAWLFGLAGSSFSAFLGMIAGKVF